MTMLLLIRSADDVRCALKAASQFLVYRRQHFAEALKSDEVLGIWLRPKLDADWPTWISVDQERAGCDSLDVPARDASKVILGESGLGIRESFSVTGLWTLCRLDGTLLRTAQSATERRRTILDSLLGPGSAPRSSSATQTFFPVFAALDAVEFVNATLSDLAGRYPQMIGGTWFLDDRERGIVPAQG